ncbi:O-antigen ligase family protein [Nocardioides sp. SYSU DS0651]|uniref:O-antigen ligase family protein n=1 Tax=Nocardioides sp. SYSU DS0651 TaxID=3415955 RepID=UPI003F4C2200
MQSQANAGPSGSSRSVQAPAGSGVLVTLAVLAALAGLVFLSTTDLVGALASVGIAVYLAGIAVLGATRMGVATLMAGFATAPAYKGLAPEGADVTPTDGLVVIGFALLLPVVLSGRIRLPLTHLIGTVLIITAGSIATLLSDYPLLSGISMVLWLSVIFGLPMVVTMWDPSSRVIELLVWSYVVGHIASWAGGIATGGITPSGRHIGLTNHPNYFGQAGMMSLALLIYLFFRYRSTLARTVVLGAAAICGLSILFSGSRGATIVVAVLILMIPFVERSAVTGFVWALVGGLLIALLPFVVQITGETSAVERLLGDEGTTGSNQVREQGLEGGIEKFFDHPWAGIGLIEFELFHIHNNFLEVAVGIGIFGLIGYVLVLYAFARPLFSDLEHRRLCYTVWGFMGWGMTIPSLYDRSLWLPIALSATCWVAAAKRRDDPPSGVAPGPTLATAGGPAPAPSTKEV